MRINNIVPLIAIILVIFALSACTREKDHTSIPGEKAVTKPSVFFKSPTDQAIIPVTTSLVFGVTGLEVEPAGDVHKGAGHLHLLVDTEFIPAGEVIPKDDLHHHLGTGALETTLTLAPGPHTLRLQFADGAHTALEGNAYRAEIHVTAEPGAPAKAIRIVSPTDGATVSGTFTVMMAATGLIVEPAGDVHEGAGHLHVLVDTDFVMPGEVIPKDDQYHHLGTGAFRTTLTLAPGSHIVRLQFADGAHTAHAGDAYRDEVHVTVQ